MSPQQIDAVRRSFALLAPQAEWVGTLFYRHLFQIDPALQARFRGDARQHGMRLMQSLATAVQLLDQPQRLRPMLQALGARHHCYGAPPAAYVTAAGALLDTLSVALGDRFDVPTCTAWMAAYRLVSETMMEATPAMV